MAHRERAGRRSQGRSGSHRDLRRVSPARLSGSPREPPPGLGIRELDIYLLGRRLVMIVETDGRDVGECFAKHRGSAAPRVIEWEALMKSLQERPPGERARRMVGRDAPGLPAGGCGRWLGGPVRR